MAFRIGKSDDKSGADLTFHFEIAVQLAGQRLYELHFEQDMVLQAPLVMTFCADMYRTRRWLAAREGVSGVAALNPL